jgi:glycosyltransferase involved in cell wall biosynthesis
MRLLMLAQFFPPDIGGEERHVLNLATTLARRGHEVAVATQQLDGVPAYEVLDAGVRVHRFATMAMSLPGVYSTGRPHHPPFPDPVGVRHLAHIVEQERPDVVHAHNWIVNSAVALRRGGGGRGGSAGSGPVQGGARPRFGLVLTLHDYSQICATKRLMFRDETICDGPSLGRCLPCATAHYGPVVGPVTVASTAVMRPLKSRAIDHVVSVSHAVARSNGMLPGPGCSVIPNFVPDDLAPPAQPGSGSGSGSGSAEGPAIGADGNPLDLPVEPYLLFVGDLSADKGILTILQAYERLSTPRPPMVFIGRPTPETPTRLPEGVVIRHSWPHPDVLTAFSRSLAAVLPSVWPDPCPTTVLEAMACRTPVVSTAIGGIVDEVVDGDSGLLVPPGDVAALADALQRVVDHEVLRDKLVAGGLTQVRTFMATSVAERLEGVYAEVIAKAGGRSPVDREGSA